MANYKKAADMFRNLAGEGNALAEYCETLALNFEHAIIKDRIEERCADELNHVLGDLCDALELSGLKISSDSIDNMLDKIKDAVGE